jgi:peptidoglycan/xylan/chitin deacetylase (PgdA/CDA1 family)
LSRIDDMTIGSFGRAAVGAAVHWSGAGRAFEMATHPAGAIILMYHSVAPDEAAPYIQPANRIHPALFERQMAFLAAERRVVALSDLVDDIAAGRTPPAGTVCITLDDGYRDNLTLAAPILEKYRLPATLFLVTGYVERAETQSSDTLHWLFTHATRGNAGSRAARAALHARLLESSHEQRVALLDELKRRLAPAGKPPRVTLDWDEVRELRRRYPFLEIGGKARHFSFPYGRWCAETRRAVIGAGWRSAVVADAARRVGPASDRYAMPRVEAPRSMTQLAFKTSGAYPGALALLGLS